MLTHIRKILFFIFLYHIPVYLLAQHDNNLTLVYDISIIAAKKNTGLEETYNGGIKTIMVRNDQARIRLVSLMRIQSIFIRGLDSLSQKTTIVKESGPKKYKCRLSPSDWRVYNSKYEGKLITFENDSATLLGYHCKKAIITLKDGKRVAAYYTTALNPLQKSFEPMFEGIPGIVLQYKYEEEKGSITYTASQVSFKEIDESAFLIPVKGYAEIKYRPGF